MNRTRKRSTCNHEWIDEYDPVADAAAYNDGFNYVPAFEVCPRCGEKRKIGDRSWPDWGFILWFPFILVGMLLLDVLLPIISLAAAACNALFSEKAS